jgi:hypothetical protein
MWPSDPEKYQWRHPQRCVRGNLTHLIVHWGNATDEFSDLDNKIGVIDLEKGEKFVDDDRGRARWVRRRHLDELDCSHHLRQEKSDGLENGIVREDEGEREKPGTAERKT